MVIMTRTTLWTVYMIWFFLIRKKMKSLGLTHYATEADDGKLAAQIAHGKQKFLIFLLVGAVPVTAFSRAL